MPSDAERCREHAKECWAWAAGTKNPSLKESLTDLAKRWARLATELRRPAFFSRKSEGSPSQQKLARSQ